MREENDYIINVETLLILPYGKGRSIVYEMDETLIINLDILQIIKNSCLFFGSSLEGRKEGTKYLINCEMKVPIIVEDSKLIIFFFTSSMAVQVSFRVCGSVCEYTNKTATMQKPPPSFPA